MDVSTLKATALAPKARSRAATPSPKASDATKGSTDAKRTPEPKREPNSLHCKGFLRQLPPQICTLALGLNGLNTVALHWMRILGLDAAFAPVTWILPFIALSLLTAYAAKVLVAPEAALADASEPATLSALSAAPAVTQAIVTRFRFLMPLEATQGMIITCEFLSLAIALRFLWLNYQKRMCPDPSWFPPVLLWGMTNITAHAAGPDWLRNLMTAQFLVLMIVYVPLKLIVAFRILISKTRHSVAPNAGMNTLMAPASFFAMVHFSTGKPGGDVMGALLFADSSLFLLVTLGLLYSRRSLWARAFHPSYVAFTFPSASTAATALLAAEHLPCLRGAWSSAAWAWAGVLAAVATAVTLSVFVRFMWFLRDAWKMTRQEGGKKD